MKEIWTKDQAEYHGRYVNFDAIWSWPKPVQKPHPPILVGGVGEHALKRAVAYGEGWSPTFEPERDVAPRIEQLQRMAAEAGRATLPVTIFSTPARPEVLERFTDIGVDRAVFFLNAASEAESLEWLDERVALVEEFRRAGA
jgi:alkanesulfonate monooxygenase SsuD/methylene tetrahydromethanopterin reductase-like flavin-dependent oxidoreductase (luciferase family)